MASVVKKMECYNIRKSVKDLGEDLKEKSKQSGCVTITKYWGMHL